MIKFEIKQLDLESFKQAMNSDTPTLVKFYNPSCHLCNGLRPIFADLQQTYGDRLKFAKLNVVKHPRIAKVFKIEGVPELFVIKKDFVQQIPYPDDDIADPHCGYPKQYIIDHLEKTIDIFNYMNDNMDGGC